MKENKVTLTTVECNNLVKGNFYHKKIRFTLKVIFIFGVLLFFPVVNLFLTKVLKLMLFTRKKQRNRRKEGDKG